MIIAVSNNKLVVLILLSISIFFLGCEKKTDKIEQSKQQISNEQVTTDSSSITDEPVGEKEIPIPDIKGTWTGTFDGKSTTLEIVEQTDSSFSGKISINYKQPLYQTVKGSFTPSTLKISMVDQLHSKFMGKYSGELSLNYDSFSGTFTKNRDGSKYSFNLNKK
jgi:hypothetical protein